MFSSGDFTHLFEQGEDTLTWSIGSGHFYLLLKRAEDSWMDMSPLSSMTEQ